MTDQVNTDSDQKNTEGSIFTPEGQTDTSSTSKTQEVHTPDYNAVFGDQLKSITDEKGEPKYKDVPTALAAAAAAQQHIRTLEDENSRLRTVQTQTDTLETAFANMAANKETGTTNTPSISADQIEDIALRAIAQREQATASASNLQEVEATLVGKYGDFDKAKAALATKAVDLGLSVQALTDLSKTSPKAVLAYFDAKPEGSPATVKSSINSQASLSPQKAPEDYMARFSGPANSSINKWNELGRELNK